MDADMGEVGIPLAGGRSVTGVVRIGETVRRPLRARSSYVHSVLRLLESVGFDGAPRFLGMDSDGREILSYIEGCVPHEPVDWTDEKVAAIARLTRCFHDATAGTELAESSEVVCHNDIAPWNTVLVDGMPRAFIDFDDAAPGSRLDDLSYILWVFLELGPGVELLKSGERARMLFHAYGMDALAGEFADPLNIALERQQARVLLGWEARLATIDHEKREFARMKVAEIRSHQRWLVENWREFAGELPSSGSARHTEE